MKINTLLTIFITLFSFCCHDKVVRQPETAGVKIENKNDTIPEMNLLDSEYEVKKRMTDSVVKLMMPNVPTMNLAKLNKPFYKYMTGTFNGESAILNLNFAHLTYDGKWAFSGTLFFPTSMKNYEVWSSKYEEQNHINLYVTDKAEANFDNLFVMMGHFDDKNVLKGLTLNNKNLKQGIFEFKETNTEGVFFDMTECFVRELYKGQVEDDRKYHLVYEKSLPTPKSNKNQRTSNFLKKHFKEDANCSSFCNSFVISGSKAITKELIEALKDSFPVRNSEYLLRSMNCVYWNEDDLVVIYKGDWDMRTLGDYGENEVNFDTYDIKRKRKITEKDVFNAKYDEEFFAKNILNYFHWDYTPDEKGKVKLGLYMSKGFTSKGFYMVGKGNHGWYVSPVFIPYQVVETFLRDDFKNQYWKK